MAVIVLFLVMVIAVLTILLLKNRRAYEKELEQATTVLERVIQEDCPVDELTYDEGPEAKLVYKAIRIAEINKECAAMVDDEQKKTQELVADISHQMRTPLSSILMYTELLEDEGLPQKERTEFLQRISDSSEKLHWLVSEFITIARFEAKSLKLQIEKGELHETVQEAIAMHKEQGKQKSISFAFQSESTIKLSYDKRWTREAISNILDNAVKYSSEGTEVTIEIEQLVFYTRIRIINTGTVLASSEQLQVFQKYYRGTNAEKTEGAGIGLYLVKLILEEQGGYGIMESRNGQTAVSLFLLN